MPSACVVDFEKGLINAAKYEVLTNSIVGCFFHFKQAIFRKVRKFGLSIIDSKVMSNRINLLTLVPRHDLRGAIKFIRQQEMGNVEKFAAF
jgi:hypothetical protein